ncbi:hypothetical protein DNTS_005534 [Danionella cerebrum]|uniref:HAP1 N-terminal domain-containing protein n=1 Tax=Danionella cerebrum TaxID=2873325 RepID=A0A553NJQ2_9TELE|nr:hypothetical protein DNTS_005534 [Danionella translucida]
MMRMLEKIQMTIVMMHRVCSGGVCKSGKLDGSGSERDEAEAAGAQRLEPQKHHVADTTQETPLSTHSQYRDAQTITDVCNSVSLAEVEIFSLLEETLPLYTLRAESVYGYDHDDWIHTPLVPPDTHTQLKRVEQMTKTYNDIDAVTRLLEEKERDLELAARIGQSLLQKNSSLAEQNQNLDEQLSLIREEVSQLHHELNLKDELLQFYTSAAEEEEEDEGTRTPPADAARGGPSDALQLKLRELQEENLSLRSEAIHLRSETESYEQKEQQLLKDCVRELRESSSQVTHLSEELWRKTEEASRQQEQITLSLAQTVELQRKSKTLAVENEELSQHLSAAKDAQRQLTVELLELQDKYSECVEMLREAHVELKHLRGRSVCGCMGTHRRFHPLGLYPMDSLAAEIEGNMRKELSLDQPDEEEEDEHNLQQRVFEKVKNIKSSSSEGPSQIPGSNQMLCFSPGSARSGSEPDNRTLSLLQENSTSDTHGGKCSGSADLQLALRRLSLRRQNSVSERLFFQRESVCERQDTHRPLHCDIIMSSRPYLPNKLQIVKPLEGSQTLQHWQQLARPHLGGILDTRPGVIPKGFRPLNPDQNLDQNQSPDHNLNLDLNQVYHYPEYEEEEDPGEQYFQSLPTTSSANRSIQSGLSNAPSALATPSSSISLEPAFSESAVYYPGKCMAHTSSTYTFTTCKILHPSDELTTVTHRYNSSDPIL